MGPLSATPVLKLAVYHDGTIRRTPIARYLLKTAPRGLMVATLSPGALAQLQADVEVASAEPPQAFLGDGTARANNPFANVIDVGAGRSCFGPWDGPSTSCRSEALRSLHADVVTMLDKTEAAWRASTTGTVSLRAERQVDGPWPLAEAQAIEHDSILGAEDGKKLLGRLYRLDASTFVAVGYRMTLDDGTVAVYLTRMKAVTLDDALADLRAELLESVERFVTSKGTWLGVDAGARFPIFKNGEIAVVPATATEAERVYDLYPIESLDLRGGGAISF